jgi:glucose/mannose transport system permease protein
MTKKGGASLPPLCPDIETHQGKAMAHHSSDADFRTRLQDWIPKLVLSPSLAAMLIFVYGFIAFTIYLSFSDSKMLPSYDLVGFENYAKLWNL